MTRPSRLVFRLLLLALLLVSAGGLSSAVGIDLAALPSIFDYVPARYPPQELREREVRGEKLLFVDVRGEEQYRKEHIAGALNMPWHRLARGHAQLPKDRLMALY